MKFRVISLLLIGVVAAGLFLISCSKKGEQCECVVTHNADKGTTETFPINASDYSKQTCGELESFMNTTYGGEMMKDSVGNEVLTHAYTCKAV